MANRTIVVGDIHGELGHLVRLWSKLPELDAGDTLVFLGDYVDRGPDSRDVVDFLRQLPRMTAAKLVFLLGNHEHSWLRVIDGGFPEFVLPLQNGCWQCAHSYCGRPAADEEPTEEDRNVVLSGSFFPPDTVAWMRNLEWFYEDSHGIYVHAGLPDHDGRFLHPSEVPDPVILLWLRSPEFFRDYHGKRVICGHTATEDLPDLSTYTPDDPTDLWHRGDVIAIDTKCGKEGGFLTALELPAMHVYESR
jgi:serine/threonine protein phosphatase 1